MNKWRLTAALFIGLASALPAQSTKPAASAAPTEGKISKLNEKSEFEYDLKNNVWVGSNGVVITFRDATLTADKVVWNQETGDADAEGNVRIQQGAQIFLGEKVRYNFKTRQIVTGEFRTGHPPFFAQGKGLHLDQERNVYSATNVFVTTDDHPGTKLGIRARQMTFVPDEYYEARNATFELGGVPVMYLPYYRRRMGENVNHWNMVPGYRSKYGPFLLNTYNWYWNERLEGAVHADYRVLRGVGAGPEFQYDLGRLGGGEFSYYYANDQRPPTDLVGKEVNPDRQDVYYYHRADITSNLTARIMARYQTDPFVLRDFFESEYHKNIQPDSFLEVNQLWRNFSLDVFVQPRLNDYFDTVERLPEARLSGFRQQIGNTPLYYESESSVGWYRHQFAYDLMPEFMAFRGDTYHQIVLPYTLFGWLNVTPRVGERLTYYSEAHGAGATTTEENRSIFNTGAEVSTKISRVFPGAHSRFFEINELRHIIEPSVNYAYIPSPSHRPMELPQFDPELPSFRLLPIEMPEYNSIDAIDGQNVLRLSLRNRFQTKREDRIEHFANWAVYTDWRLQPQHGQRTYADLYSDLEMRPKSWVDMRSLVRYGLSEDYLKEVFSRVSFVPVGNWSFTFGQRYLRSDPVFGMGQNLYMTGLFYRLNENWAFRTSHHFEARDQRLEEQYYTVYRDLRSWTSALTLRFRDNRGGADDITVAFTFSLKAFPRFHLNSDTDRPALLIGY